jgi:hypothetical protein
MFFPVLHCNSQDWEKIDSLSLIHREKADIVLSCFDTIKTDKMLYSIKDKYYYVIVNRKSYYEEYYAFLDTANEVKIINLIKNNVKTKEQQKQRKQYEQILKDAEPIFDLDKYHIGYVTQWPNTKWEAGTQSYFVIKNIDGKRYGEYSSSSITVPSPINSNLWIYLFRKLSEQIE